MAEIVNARYLPSGWLFGVKWRNWVGGVIDAAIPFARNEINVLLGRELDVATRQKRFIVVGVHKADFSYNAGTLTLVASPRVKGFGYDTLPEALQKVRDVVVGDGSTDIGNLKNLKTFLATMNQMVIA